MQHLIASSRRQVWAGLLGSFSSALVVVKILGFGKQVTITGKVDSVDLISIYLKECELVDE